MIILYCGSFDPIHLGHVSLARYVASLPQCNEVWITPSRRNPLKKNAPRYSDEERLALAHAAVEDVSRIEVCDIEMHLPLPSYTINTLRHLQLLYPSKQFSLLIGADNWADFHLWRDSEEIISHFGVWIYPRPGYDIDLTALPENVCYLPDAPQMDVSSTEVRSMMDQNMDVTALTGCKVAKMLHEINDCE